MSQNVRYSTSKDGVRIAFTVEGEGPPLVVIPYFLESFALEHLVPAYAEFMDRLGEGRQLIRYDYRGCGSSQHGDIQYSQELLENDFEAVIEAAGLDRFAMWLSTTAGPNALSYAGKHPERVSALVVYATFARTLDAFTHAALASFSQLSRSNWQLAAQLFGDMTGRREFPEASIGVADLYQQATDGESAARFMDAGTANDATPFLPEIKARTLIMHRIEDPLYPMQLSQDIAASIPGARFVPLQGRGHIYFLGNSEDVLSNAIAFLDEDPETRRIAPADEKHEERSGFRAILFTDLVGHTQMMHRLGDDKGRDVLREHETVTRTVLKHHGGAEVKTMGDGFMASFPSVTKGVECAIALQKAFDERNVSAAEPLNVRVGLNAGEPIEEDGDLFGETVIMAARIAAMAKGGEILSSLGVRELCGGKGFLFADRGEHAMRGFEDPVRVFEISWRG
jgi:class 3 adenylate cyclase